MEDKLNIVICYGVIGLIIALWPVLLKEEVTSRSLQEYLCK